MAASILLSASRRRSRWLISCHCPSTSGTLTRGAAKYDSADVSKSNSIGALLAIVMTAPPRFVTCSPIWRASRVANGSFVVRPIRHALISRRAWRNTSESRACRARWCRVPRTRRPVVLDDSPQSANQFSASIPGAKDHSASLSRAIASGSLNARPLQSSAFPLTRKFAYANRRSLCWALRL